MSISTVAFLTKHSLALGIAAAGLLCSAPPAFAGLIDFGDNPINFTAPHITSGDATISSFGPTLVPLSDGFQVMDIGYTVTANSNTENTGEFSADRDFTLFADPLTKFQLKGSTKVTQTGADSSVELLIDAVIDGKSVQLTGIETINGVVNNREVKWDFTIEVDVAAGPHKLEQKPIYNFDPGAAGDTVKVDSLYQITASVVPVPEPSMFVLLSVGLAGLAGIRSYSHRRR